MDFNEIFLPVVKHRSIRFVLSLVAQFDLKLEQMDVKMTFMYGELEETIYMKQPKGFEIKGKKDQVNPWAWRSLAAFIRGVCLGLKDNT